MSNAHKAYLSLGVYLLISFLIGLNIPRGVSESVHLFVRIFIFTFTFLFYSVILLILSKLTRKKALMALALILTVPFLVSFVRYNDLLGGNIFALFSIKGLFSMAVDFLVFYLILREYFWKGA